MWKPFAAGWNAALVHILCLLWCHFKIDRGKKSISEWFALLCAAIEGYCSVEWNMYFASTCTGCCLSTHVVHVVGGVARVQVLYIRECVSSLVLVCECALMHRLKGVSQHLRSLEDCDAEWIMLTEAVTSLKKGTPDAEPRRRKGEKEKKDPLKDM